MPADKETYMHMDKMFNEQITSHYKTIAQVSMFIIRWLVIINGSACIALLALIGNTWGKGTKNDFIEAILPPIVLFALACVSALLTAGGLYFNFFYIASATSLQQDIIFQRLGGKNENALLESKFQRYCRIVIVSMWSAVILAIISLALFVSGGRLLYCNLQEESLSHITAQPDDPKSQSTKANDMTGGMVSGEADGHEPER